MIQNKNVYTLNCRGKLLSLESPILMGILNITPDSFFDGGKYQNESSTLQQAEKLLKEGVEILDIGGYSTRPNALHISIEEEKNRVLPTLELILKHFPETIISVDTFRAEIAKESVKIGASIINDISGGELDETMFDTLAALQVPYILMHSRGNPQTMQHLSNYENILSEILQFFNEKIQKLLNLGVKDIVLDIGFGFAKTLEQNYFLLKNLAYFHQLELPILVGISRKSMIYKALGIDAAASLNGTSILHSFALQQGASILRVHDAKEAKEAIKLYEILR
ncbi:MAG: dihydropteroate synthase [Thermonemataceae bacterium]|nr:dihydropteroate synthase [Thermonemataceae bacterium]